MKPNQSIAVALATTLLALGLNAGASNAPESITPGADESLLLRASATGVQIYECRASGDKDPQHAWVFVAPEAQLFDRQQRAIGSHGAGPVWEAKDGSRVVGAVKQRASAPRAGAIPWLLLSTSAQGPQGLFSRVSSIQRIDTVGGIAPAAAGCTPATAGSIARVPYTADYLFYTAPRKDARLSSAY